MSLPFHLNKAGCIVGKRRECFTMSQETGTHTEKKPLITLNSLMVILFRMYIYVENVKRISLLRFWSHQDISNCFRTRIHLDSSDIFLDFHPSETNRLNMRENRFQIYIYILNEFFRRYWKSLELSRLSFD